MDTNNFFCVFWFPTIFHCEKKNRFNGNQLGPYEIDDASLNPLTLTITRRESGDSNLKGAYDLIFGLSDKNGKTIDTCFTCVEQSRNGFVIYSYDREQIINDYCSKIAGIDRSKVVVDEIIDALFISFYHYAKLFYHEHESDSECDGRYAAYYYTQETEEGPRKYLKVKPFLSTHNNPVINWYLDQFEKQIISNAENISQKLRDWTPLIEAYTKTPSDVKKAVNGNDEEQIERTVRSIQVQLDEKQDPEGIPQNIRSIKEKKQFLTYLYQSNLSTITKHRNDELAMFLLLCNNSLIEYTYCKTLLESKYNDNYKHDSKISAVEPQKDEKDRCRKKAFNIRNSIRYIESAKRKCEIWQNNITETLLDEIHILSSQVNKQVEKNTALTEKVDEQTGEVSKLLAENTALTEKVREQTEEVGKLVTENTALTGEVRTQTGAVSQLVTENTALTKKVGEQTVEVGEWVTKNTELTKEVSTQTNQVKELLKESEKANKLSTRLGRWSVVLGIISIILGILSFVLGMFSLYLAKKGGEIQQESHQCEPQSTTMAIADTTIDTTTVTFDTPFVDIPNNMVKEKGDTTTDKKSNNR